MPFWTNLSANQKINRKISELEDAVEILQKGFRKLQSTQDGQDVEFSALYGKVRTLAGRIEKRAAIIEASQQTPEEEEAASPDGLPSTEAILTPRQLQWQKTILRERGRSA